MARKQLNPKVGDEDFFPRTAAERRAHADALSRAHEGHHCAERAESLCEAGEYYTMLGETELAEQMFREALAVEEAEPGNVHAAYASFLLDQDRHEEALAMIADARRLHPDGPMVFNLIAESLAAHGYHQQAVRWATAGLVAVLGNLTDLTLDDLSEDIAVGLLARARYRSRQALELPADHIDTLVAESLQQGSIASA